MEKLLSVLSSVLSGRFSLQVVVLSSVLLFWTVMALAAYMLLFRGYHRLRRRYREGRTALYRPGIKMVLLDEPLGLVVAALRPKRWGDASVVQALMLENMRHLEGRPYETLRQAADKLGFVERNLRALRSRRAHRRGRAMERLGILRARRAVPAILEALDRESLDLQLVALRALASIGDPALIDRFVAQADTLPPPLIPRLASLLFEFGAPGRAAVAGLINRRPEAFPPALIKELLREFAADFEATA